LTCHKQIDADPYPVQAWHSDADQDLDFFYADVDPDADPGNQIEGDPCGSGSTTLPIRMHN